MIPIREMMGMSGAGAAPTATRLAITYGNASNVTDGTAKNVAIGVHDVLGCIPFAASATSKICT